MLALSRTRALARPLRNNLARNYVVASQTARATEAPVSHAQNLDLTAPSPLPLIGAGKRWEIVWEEEGSAGKAGRTM